MRPAASPSPAVSDLERTTVAKVGRRLIPFMVLLYVVAYLDRVNVGFAALTMNDDIGISAYLYGWGAGIFFLAYFLFEVPSNVVLERTGARLWIARIMITWGLISAGMALVVGPWSFLVLRFLLGAAEAGFFPGMILYMTYWFPKAYRARLVAGFMIAIPVASMVGSPLSAALLELDGLLGLAGWQWLFILEGIPAVVLGFVVLGYLTDRPAEAAWLEPREREWLEATLASERADVERSHRLTLRDSLTDRRVVLLGLAYFSVVTGLYGLTFFLPQIVKGLGFSTLATGFVSAVPFAVGCVSMILWGRSSDKSGERRGHTAVAGLVAAVGFLVAAAFGVNVWSLAGLVIAAVGIYGALPVFWPMPSVFLTGTAAAAGIAMINAIGNLGGFVGPYLVGWVREATASFSGGLVLMAAFAASTALFILLLGDPAAARRPEEGGRPAE